MTPELHSAAIANNLGWYCAVMDARNAQYKMTEHWWSLSERAPPYYSDFVTRSACGMTAQLTELRALSATHRPHRWCVADCFAALDTTTMASLGFSRLFDAMWFASTKPVSTAAETPVHFEPVRTAIELDAWETQWQAWSPTSGTRVFLPAILNTPGNTFWRAMAHGDTVGGAITHADEQVVGLSNVFLHGTSGAGAFLRDAARHALEAHPGRRLVGYGDNSELADLAPLGVTPLGTHRVWLSA